MDVITATQLLPVLSHLSDGVMEGMGAQIWDSLVKLVRNKRRRNKSLARAIDDVQAAPSDRGRLEALARELEHEGKQDPDFGAQLHDWYASASIINTGGSNSNTISGTVHGNAAQVRDVHGDISFGGTPER